jgi:CheY-like chemotaxis protein
MSSRSGRRILVVEEEATTALILENMLRKLGCKVPGRAGRTADALAIIETDRQRLDAAMVDIALSRDVVPALTMRSIPVIITDGPASMAAVGKWEGPVLYRPFHLEDLKNALESLELQRLPSSRGRR